MSNESLGELYFVGIMMVMILILSFGATYVFFRQYKKEKQMAKEEKDRANQDAENTEGE